MAKRPNIEDYRALVDASPLVHSHGKLIYIIHELSRLIAANFDHAMVQHRMTHGQWWAIMHLYENEGATQSDLANIMQMGRASAGRLFDRMEAKGWIERRGDARDNRVRRVYLADGVVPAFKQMGVEGKALFDRLLGDLDDAAERQLLDSLRKIRGRAESGATKS